MLLKCKCHLFCYWFAHRKYQKFNLCRKCYESRICKSFFIIIINIITERSTSKGRSRKTAFRKLVFWKNLIKRLFSRNLNQYQGFSSFAYINHLWLSILLHACLSVVVVFWRSVYRVLELFIECSANASPQPCQTSPALVIEEYNLLRCPCAWVIAVLTFETQCSFFYCLLGCGMACPFLQWCKLKKHPSAALAWAKHITRTVGLLPKIPSAVFRSQRLMTWVVSSFSK